MNVEKFRETVCVRLFLYEIVGYRIVPFIVIALNCECSRNCLKASNFYISSVLLDLMVCEIFRETCFQPSLGRRFNTNVGT